MKRVRRFWTSVVACGVAFVAASVMFSSQALATQGKAVVRSIRGGSASYSDDNVSWKPLSIDQTLGPGASVKTDENAIVDLYLGANGPVVRVTPATTLALTTLMFDKTSEETVITTELNLSSGRILGAVKKLAAASKYEVKTPTSTCGIRGTQYDISADGRIIVIEGTVSVAYTPPSGPPVIFNVGMGQTFDPAANNNQGGVVPTPTADFNRTKNEIQLVINVVQPGPAMVYVIAPPKMVPTPGDNTAYQPPVQGKDQDLVGRPTPKPPPAQYNKPGDYTAPGQSVTITLPNGIQVVIPPPTEAPLPGTISPVMGD